MWGYGHDGANVADAQVPPDAIRSADPSAPAASVIPAGDAAKDAAVDAPVPVLAPIWNHVLGQVDLCPPHSAQQPGAREKRLNELTVFLQHNPWVNSSEIIRRVYGGAASEKTVTQQVSMLRARLGVVRPGGPKALPPMREGGYHLDNAVRSDWMEFERLVEILVETTPTANLIAAMDLVTGPLLGGIPPKEWAWTRDLRDELRDRVADAAVALARRHHLTKQFGAAVEIARKGLWYDNARQDLWQVSLEAALDGHDKAAFRALRSQFLSTVPGPDRDPAVFDLTGRARWALDPLPEPRRASPTGQSGTDTSTSTRPVTMRRRRIAMFAVVAVVILASSAAIPYWVNYRQHKSVPSPPSTIFANVTAAIPVGEHPEGVAVDPAAHAVYTANYGDNSVSVIDTSSRTVTATIPVGRGPFGVAVDPAAHIVYTANNRDDSLSVIDATSRTVIATIKVGTNPWGVAVDPAAHTAYAANNWDNTVSVIDTSSDVVTATINVGKHPEWVAVDPTTHTAYVANNSDGTISVIDTANHTITTTTINVGNGPLGVAVDPTAPLAYTVNSDDNTVSVIDATSRTVIATIKVGTNPWGVAVDPAAHTAYTTNSSDGTVSVIDTANYAVTTTINVGNRLWAVAVDPTTHTAYTTASNNTVSIIEPAR